MTVLYQQITLQPEDLMCAAVVAYMHALRKVAYNRNTGERSNTGRPMHEIIADGVKGNLGEIAWSRMLGKPWTPGGSAVSCGDVGNIYEVRTTHYLTGCMLIYRTDKDDAIISLLIGDWPYYKFVGCIKAKDGKRDEFWKADSNPACWWVPQHYLMPLGF